MTYRGKSPSVWHVSDPSDEEWFEDAQHSGGYVVMAESPEDAIRQVVEREHADFLDYCREEHKQPTDDLERWYHVGISKKRWPTEWMVRPIETPYRIQFLGHSW